MAGRKAEIAGPIGLAIALGTATPALTLAQR
jgi:hypothetical protein